MLSTGGAARRWPRPPPPRRLSCATPARYYIASCNTLNLTRAEAISLSLPKSASCPTRSTPWPLFEGSYRVAFGRGHRLASLAAIAPQALEGESLLGRRRCESTTRLRDLSC
jgi:hypothetical protein